MKILFFPNKIYIDIDPSVNEHFNFILEYRRIKINNISDVLAASYLFIYLFQQAEKVNIVNKIRTDKEMNEPTIKANNYLILYIGCFDLIFSFKEKNQDTDQIRSVSQTQYITIYKVKNIYSSFSLRLD